MIKLKVKKGLGEDLEKVFVSKTTEIILFVGILACISGICLFRYTTIIVGLFRDESQNVKKDYFYCQKEKDLPLLKLW